MIDSVSSFLFLSGMGFLSLIGLFLGALTLIVGRNLWIEETRAGGFAVFAFGLAVLCVMGAIGLSIFREILVML